ncbi:hypothetical protein ACSHXN_00130 [Streptomyces sp. HUAS TT11]|uniref:hypothetical protein n=1 Tax=Streptomyces sp. HUAS TT11 TaxID=3447508 RepID=UPI003F657BDC
MEKTPSGSPWPTGHRFADRTRASHAAVHALHATGHSRRAIQRQLGMTYRTVKILADATVPEELFRGQWQGRPSVLDEYKPYLDDRWNQGCTNAWKAWEEIVPLGYAGSYQRVRAYFRTKRLWADPVTAPPPSPRTVAGWILRHPTPSQRPNSSVSRPSWSTAPRWKHSLDMSGPSPRSSPSGKASGCPSGSTPSALSSPGLTLPWNSGVVEGHVNRIKVLKRQMFGRAGFQLLRKRVLLYR